jgi:phage FluMu gp28-like protein
MTSGKLFSKEGRLNYADAFIRVDQKPLDLDFWQEHFLMDANKYSIVLKSRRTGFSFIVALKGMVKAMDPNRFNYVRQFVSYNEEDAKEKIRYASMFYHSIPDRHKKKLVSETKTSMEFYDVKGKTTSRLISIACRPPRGRGGDIVFDEMAIYPANKAGVIYTAGLPVTARGGCVEIGSTPLGKIGQFYDIFSDKDNYKNYARYTVPWWFAGVLCTNVPRAVKQAPLMDTDERVSAFGTQNMQTYLSTMLKEDFQQEYECTFIDSAVSFITMDLIQDNTPGLRSRDRIAELPDGLGEAEDIDVKIAHSADEIYSIYELNRHGRLYVGYDVARRRDAAVIFVIGYRPDGKKISVAEIDMRNKPFEYQLDQFRKIMKSPFPVMRACIDQTGQGEPLCERLQTEFGATMVEGVLFNQESKEMLAIAVRTGLEKREFLLQNDNKFHKQIHSIKRIATSGGHFRYDSERDENGHADSFWAWALANNAVIENKNHRPGFYAQVRASKEKVIESAGVVAKTKPARTRGKSYAAVIRSMNRG